MDRHALGAAGPLLLLLSACGGGGGDGGGSGSVVVAPTAPSQGTSGTPATPDAAAPGPTTQTPSGSPSTGTVSGATPVVDAGAIVVPPTPAEPEPAPAPAPIIPNDPKRPVVRVTPNTLGAALAAATGGETIQLTRGDYGRIELRGRRFAAGLVIEAPADAELSISLQEVDGVTLRGGTLAHARGAGPLGYGANILDSRNIVFDGVAATDSTRGVVINRSQDITLLNISLYGLRSDGIDIAASQRVIVDGATCENFSPADGDHPDCIQAWSVGDNIVSDVLITNVRVEGTMQGIFFGNGDEGGFDRVRIIDNVVVAGFGNGVGVYDCRACELIGNRVSTFPGSPNQSRVVMIRGSVTHRGNSHAAYNGKPAWAD